MTAALSDMVRDLHGVKHELKMEAEQKKSEQALALRKMELEHEAKLKREDWAHQERMAALSSGRGPSMVQPQQQTHFSANSYDESLFSVTNNLGFDDSYSDVFEKSK
jgi:hypothetical protein